MRERVKEEQEMMKEIAKEEEREKRRLYKRGQRATKRESQTDDGSVVGLTQSLNTLSIPATASAYGSYGGQASNQARQVWDQAYGGAIDYSRNVAGEYYQVSSGQIAPYTNDYASWSHQAPPSWMRHA